MTDTVQLASFVDRIWSDEIERSLSDYIAVPAKSPNFDPDWAANGFLDQVLEVMRAWAEPKVVQMGGTLEVIRLEARTPVMFMEIPGTDGGDASADTVFMYGHLDKQPEATGWDEGLGPWTPVIRDGKLYGRGAADDGYAIYGSLAALLAVRDQGLPHARTVVLIEACEESGSFDLPAYFEHLAPRIGQPSLVVCLDSGCGDYDRLWLTTSLRGMAGGVLTVKVLEEGVHSGDASGLVPSSFRILRLLLDRIEDTLTGHVRLPELSAHIPHERIDQAKHVASIIGDSVWSKFPFVTGMRPTVDDPVELILNRTWRPQLSTIGAAGFQDAATAGNALRPFTSVALSMRLPPAIDGERSAAVMKRVLEENPPYGAQVSFDVGKASTGWNAPAFPSWLEQSFERASQAAWGEPPAMVGEGGSIPLITMLGETFPHAQFLITGVLGPQSNAHGPNEFLHLSAVRKVTQCVAMVLADHYARKELRQAA